jgi:PAS domain S-box-containing protein
MTMTILRIPEDYPIRKKLALLFLYTLIPIFLLVSGIFLVAESFALRNSLLDEITGLAKTINLNTRASLVFNDRAGASETLASLQSIRNITYAAILDRQDKVFAAYLRDGEEGLPQVQAGAPNGHHFSLSHADFLQPIVLDNETVGRVYIRSSLAPLYLRLALYNAALLLIMGLALLVAYLLFSRLQRVITNPVISLAELMGAISTNRDYSLRSKVAASKDEFGYLAKGFNEMLDKIQARDAELETSRQRLEELVRHRTAELETTNAQLEEQLRQRIRMEEALTISEYRYRTIFETSGSASVIVDEDNTISMVNSAFEKLTGFTKKEVEGLKKWMDFVYPEDMEKMREYRALRAMNPDLAPKGCGCRLRDRENLARDAYLTVAVIPGTTRSVASILDLTDLKRLEAQLLQSQKMEAVGQLAGGVAHDFNNILTAIIGYASLIRMKVGAGDTMSPYVDSILSSAQKAANLTRGLLAFSRKQLIVPKAMDLNDVVKRMKGLLERLMGEDVEMKTRLAEGETVVFADPGQVEQILINFATNSRDAMPEGGVFLVETDSIALDEQFCVRHGYGKPGMYCRLTVSDTGEGINPVAMEHIFEPFYTTKEVGKGTGLGLSIVYGIIKQHNGYISVYSEPGEGTTFRIYLPLFRKKPLEEVAEVKETPKGGTETILLAEDDDETRVLIRRVLEEFGYKVIETCDGEEALREFRSWAPKIDLVILDVIMPKKNGKVTCEGIRQIRQDIKVMFISGYTRDILSRKGLDEENISFLPKPVSPTDLLARIRRILDGN